MKSNKMVMPKTEGGTFDTFSGKVISVDYEASRQKVNENGTSTTFPAQYKIVVETKDTKTGQMNEWIKLSPLADKDGERIVGSVMDRYMEEVERLHPEELKSATTIAETLNVLIGKSYVFKKKQLGRGFENHKARDYWYPAEIVK